MYTMYICPQHFQSGGIINDVPHNSGTTKLRVSPLESKLVTLHLPDTHWSMTATVAMVMTTEFEVLLHQVGTKDTYHTLADTNNMRPSTRPQNVLVLEIKCTQFIE